MKIGISLVGVSHLDDEKINITDGNNRVGGVRNSDMCKINIKESLIEPLRKVGEVSVYLTTYNHTRLDELIKIYTPKHTNVLEYKNSTMQRTYIKSLETLVDQDIDFIVSTRFDIRLRRFIDVSTLPKDKITILFKELGYTTFTDDNFFFIPKIMLNNFIAALNQMVSSGHPLNGMHDAIHYMKMKNGQSSVHVYDSNDQLGHNNAYYFLPRYAHEYLQRGEL